MRSSAHRGFVALASSVLATIVGLNLLVFTFVNALWLRPPPFAQPERIVAIVGMTFGTIEAPALRVFDLAAGQVATGGTFVGLQPRLRIGHSGRDLEGAGVTDDYFGVLGVTIRGRDFAPSDNREGAEPVAIISERLWQGEFRRSPDVIGSVVQGEPLSLRIIGVAPAGFEGARRGERIDVWIPKQVVPRTASVTVNAGDLPLDIFARLRPGDTAATADRRLADALGHKYPQAAVVPVKTVFDTPRSPAIAIHEGDTFGVAAGLALLVLLGGCAGLAALVTLHYERRQLEFAVRVALGGSRTQIVRGLAKELTGIAVLGTVGAISIATAAMKALPRLSLPGGVELGRLDVSIDWRVLSVAIGATVVTLLIAACLPLARVSRRSASGVLFAGAGTTTSPGSQRLRQALLAGLVASTIIVLVAAGLFARTVIHAFGDASGFDVEHTVFASVQVVPPIISTLAGLDDRQSAILANSRLVNETIQSIAGVDGVSYGIPPIGKEASRFVASAMTVQVRNERTTLRLGLLKGSPELLAVLGVPMVAGRPLSARDALQAPVPTVVTETLAARLWPGDEPVGQTMWTSLVGRSIVVGVARDFSFGSLASGTHGVIVVPRSEEEADLAPHFVVHSHDSAFTAAEIRRRLRGLSEVLPLEVLTGQEVVARDIGLQRTGAWFFSGFGVIALLLGLFEVVALVLYLAETRKREFGLRLALGASPRDLVQLGAKAALGPVVIGVAVGLVLAALLLRIFASLLVGLSSLDPATYGAVATTMLVSATLAALIGARRLTRLMPADALRTN